MLTCKTHRINYAMDYHSVKTTAHLNGCEQFNSPHFNFLPKELIVPEHVCASDL